MAKTQAEFQAEIESILAFLKNRHPDCGCPDCKDLGVAERALQRYVVRWQKRQAKGE